MDKDLKLAGVPKITSQGKVDFHASRVAFITYVLESGATVKEAQVLARHSNADLTMNTYARANDERLNAITEMVAQKLLNSPDTEEIQEKRVICVSNAEEVPTKENRKSSKNNNLRQLNESGGGGIRTPVMGFL